MRKFIIYWRDGTSKVIEGDTVNDAFTRAGFGGGDIYVVDFYADYDQRVGPTYDWDSTNKKWTPKPNIK